MTQHSIPHLSSKTSEHFTPPHIIAAARGVMGGIDLDPTSCPTANEIVMAKTIYTAADDGLIQPWWGRVFINPPGGKVGNKSLAQQFFFKAAREWLAGSVEAVVFLGFTLEILRLSQAGRALPSALHFPLCVPRERLEFLTKLNGKLVPQTDPTHANVIVYMPKTGEAAELARFERVFGAIGDVILPVNGAMRSAVPSA
jgi:ParB family chromosome partitioning protein